MPNHMWANIVKEKPAMFILPHPPYSPDLAPSDYHLFRSLSNGCKGRKFENEEELKRYLRNCLDSKSKQVSAASGICDLSIRWAKVIESNGKYIYLIDNF